MACLFEGPWKAWCKVIWSAKSKPRNAAMTVTKMLGPVLNWCFGKCNKICVNSHHPKLQFPTLDLRQTPPNRINTRPFQPPPPNQPRIAKDLQIERQAEELWDYKYLKLWRTEFENPKDNTSEEKKRLMFLTLLFQTCLSLESVALNFNFEVAIYFILEWNPSENMRVETTPPMLKQPTPRWRW